MPFNGYSEEYLDRLESNGNIQADNKAYTKRKLNSAVGGKHNISRCSLVNPHTSSFHCSH